MSRRYQREQRNEERREERHEEHIERSAKERVDIGTIRRRDGNVTLRPYIMIPSRRHVHYAMELAMKEERSIFVDYGSFALVVDRSGIRGVFMWRARMVPFDIVKVVAELENE